LSNQHPRDPINLFSLPHRVTRRLCFGLGFYLSFAGSVLGKDLRYTSFEQKDVLVPMQTLT